MNWKSIIATALITGVVTIVTGLLLYWYQNKEADIVYHTIQSIPFNGKDKKVSIFQADIQNIGRKEAEEIILVIDIRNGKIDQSILDINDTISHEEIRGVDSYTLKIKTLNPSELVKVSLLLDVLNDKKIKPNVSLRAKGVMGRSQATEIFKLSPFFIGLIALYTGLVVSLIFLRKRRINLIDLLRGRHTNQKHEIASALAIYGMPEKSKQYLKSNTSRMYWVEADQLTAEAIFSNNNEELKNTIKVLKVILDRSISDSSAGILYYNISKLYKVNGNDTRSKDYLEKAILYNKSEIERRIKFDPILK